MVGRGRRLGLRVAHHDEPPRRYAPRSMPSLLLGPTLAAASLPVMPHGPLMIIGGAEDKVRKPTILKQFVALSGGHDARIAVMPTASSLGPEVVDVYDALFTKSVPPRSTPYAPSRASRRTTRAGQALDDATGIFMTGGNQLKLSGDRLRHAAGRRDHRGPRARRGRRRHVGRREHPVLPHGGVRRRRRHAQAADDPGRGRARAGRRGGDRPALRPAQPLRPAADDRVAEPAAARHRHRRGHRGLVEDVDGDGACGCSAAVR